MRSTIALCFLVLVALLATPKASAIVSVEVKNNGHADYCYYFDGGKCNNDYQNFAWHRGETYELFIDADPTQPMRVTTDIDGLHIYDGANATDIWSGTILVTIPENEELNVIYLKCFYHNFFVAVDIYDEGEGPDSGTGGSEVVTDLFLTNFDATPCYYVNGGTECSPELTWFYGETYRLHINTSEALALLVTSDRDSATPEAYAGSDNKEPVSLGIVTVTIPESETLENLYLKALSQPWFLTINLDRAPSSSTGGHFSSTGSSHGGFVHMNMSAAENCFFVEHVDLINDETDNQCTTELAWLAGTTYILHLDSTTMAGNAFKVVTQAREDAELYAGAEPNTAEGTTSGDVTITIPSDEQLTNLYLWNLNKDFYVVVSITGTIQTGGDVSTSTGLVPSPLDEDDDIIDDDEDDDDDDLIDIDHNAANHNTASLVVTQLFAACVVSLLALL